MAEKFGLYQNLAKYKDINEDEILATLTEDELRQLEEELDPDNSLLPPSQRQRDQTTKEPTGRFDRKKLLEYLEDEAKNQKDVEDKVPYVSGVKRGRAFVAKAVPKPAAVEKDQDVVLHDEWEDALAEATEEELVDLAGILGLHTMINNVQLEASQKRKFPYGDKEMGKFDGIAKYTAPTNLPMEQANTTDVEKSIQQLDDNDSSLKELNLNNIKEISIDTFKRLCAALKNNTQLESLSAANTQMGDTVATSFGEALEDNKTLKVLNLESNFLTGVGTINLVNALEKNQTLQELRIANQRNILGNKAEVRMAKILENNKVIQKFGYNFENAGPRTKAHDSLMRNNEECRKNRTNGYAE